MIFLTPGDKIKTIRKRLGMTQKDLEAVNIKRNFISMIENGDRNPSRETARIIAEKFNERAMKQGLRERYDEKSLLATPTDQAFEYCCEKLISAHEQRDFEQIIAIADKYGLEKCKLDAYLKIGDLQLEEKQFCEALIYYIRALDSCKNIRDYEKQGMIFNKLGLCKLKEADYVEGLEYFNKALDYSKAIGDGYNMEQAIFHIIITYRKLGKYDRVIEFADLFLNISPKSTEGKQQILASLIKADALISKKAYSEAKDILVKMLVVNKDHKEFFGHIYNELGNVHLYKKEYQDAIQYYNIAQEMVEKYDSSHIHANLVDRAHLYAETGDFNVAIQLLVKGIHLAVQHKDSEYLVKGFNVISTLHNSGMCDENVEEMLTEYLEIVENFKLSINKHDVCSRLALIYMNKNNIDKAKNYLRLSLV